VGLRVRRVGSRAARRRACAVDRPTPLPMHQAHTAAPITTATIRRRCGGCSPSGTRARCAGGRKSPHPLHPQYSRTLKSMPLQLGVLEPRPPRNPEISPYSTPLCAGGRSADRALTAGAGGRLRGAGLLGDDVLRVRAVPVGGAEHPFRSGRPREYREYPQHPCRSLSLSTVSTLSTPSAAADPVSTASTLSTPSAAADPVSTVSTLSAPAEVSACRGVRRCGDHFLRAEYR
jgi:hypothetical protein